MFLAGGETVFFGRPIPDMPQFFAANGFECPRYENPADFVLGKCFMIDNSFQLNYRC